MHKLILKPKNLVIVRHAQSERNAGKKGVFYTEEERQTIGLTLNQDIGLTDVGKLEALAAGKRLKKHFDSFDIVINSGYLRTIQTMEGILKAYPEINPKSRIILQDIAIRERDAGWGYHMTQDEVHKFFPWNKEVWDLGDPFYTRPMGGESLADVVARLDTFFTRLAILCEGKNVLLVAHGRAMTCMRYLLEDWKRNRIANLPADVKNTGMLFYSSYSGGPLLRKSYSGF